MVRISVDLVNESYQFVNGVQQREICFRNRQIPTIENLGVTRDQFDAIDLTDNNIRKLDNLPLLKRLETLLLHNNRIQQIDRKIYEHLPNLSTLVLTNNNIAELGDVDPLAKCEKLEYLSLIGNPITHKQYYRQYVIYKLRSVRVLDFRRIKQVEREAADKLFKGKQGETLRKQVVKHSNDLTGEDAEEEVAVSGRARMMAKVRSTQEREKIKELIKGAKTLAEVENLHGMLQTGRIPGGGGDAAQNQDGASGPPVSVFEPEEEEDDENGMEN